MNFNSLIVVSQQVNPPFASRAYPNERCGPAGATGPGIGPASAWAALVPATVPDVRQENRSRPIDAAGNKSAKAGFFHMPGAFQRIFRSRFRRYIFVHKRDW